MNESPSVIGLANFHVCLLWMAKFPQRRHSHARSLVILDRDRAPVDCGWATVTVDGEAGVFGHRIRELDLFRLRESCTKQQLVYAPL
jgi:hypothetical protein